MTPKYLTFLDLFVVWYCRFVMAVSVCTRSDYYGMILVWKQTEKYVCLFIFYNERSIGDRQGCIAARLTASLSIVSGALQTHCQNIVWVQLEESLLSSPSPRITSTELFVRKQKQPLKDLKKITITSVFICCWGPNDLFRTS